MNFCLYRISTKEHFSLLTQTQFVEILRKSSQKSDWLYWNPGLKNWKKIEDNLDIQEWLDHSWNDSATAPALPAEYLPKSKPVPGEMAIENTGKADEFEVVDLEKKDTGASEIITVTQEVQPDVQLPDTPKTKGSGQQNTRKFPRIKGRLRTILTNKAKAFITYSRDISLGGISLENNIPKEILQGEIEVYISDPTGRKSIVFTCHPVGDAENSNRFSFSKTDGKQLVKLTQWLEDLAKTHAA